jgi:NADH:ubiquinone oxidoreductase subunit 6 (subunit J)
LLKLAFYTPYAGVKLFFNDLIFLTASISSILIIFLNNPIYCLLALIVVFFHALIFLLALKIEFLSLVFLIVYIGAIAILFLFVIMMFNLKNVSSTMAVHRLLTKQKLFLSFVTFIILGKLYFIVNKYLVLFVLNNIVNSKTNVMNNLDIHEILSHKIRDILLFSDLLYTYYAFIFILSSFILFASMIGAIILALQKKM